MLYYSFRLPQVSSLSVFVCPAPLPPQKPLSLTDAVRDPSVCRPSGGLYALGDLWKTSLPFTPEHPLETVSDVREEGGREEAGGQRLTRTSPQDT